MAMLRDWSQYGFAAVLGLIGAWAAWHRLPRLVTVLPVQVSYVDGPTVAVPEGMTLLEVSRANGVPHASLCGGRARCTTCRVRVEKGMEALGRPGRAEAVALTSIGAAPNVRLACQVRPRGPVTVTVIMRPDTPGPSVLDFVEVKEVAGAHVRAVVGSGMVDRKSVHPTELASWLGGKASYRLEISDLAQRGFPLVGGRIDYLLDQPVATVVYGSDSHPISLFVLPAKAGDPIAVRGTKHGYNVVGWSDGAFAYFAASDLARSELDRLEKEIGEVRAAGNSMTTVEGEAR
jgi:ferredoxin